MSTGANRIYLTEPDEDGVCDIIEGVTPKRTRQERVELAEREARAILAESEPEGIGYRFGSLHETRHVRRVAGNRRAHERVRPELCALADALRAFVEGN